MICLHCGEATAIDPCRACGRCPLLDGRYRLEWVLGRGPRGITWRGTRVADGLAVAIKRVPPDPGRAPGSGSREIAVLRQLAHPRIPAYLDRIDTGDDRGAYRIQSFVGGRTLAAEMLDRRHREEDVLALVVEIAAILTYLHDLRPRVVHGNISPENIIRRAGDGAVVLVDFGAVHAGSSADERSAGTCGFIAPERAAGAVGPASDLYALGLTAAVLLTGRPVEALGEHAADWRRRVKAHPETAALLDGLLAPEPTQRFDDARRVIAWTHRAMAAIQRERRAIRRAAPRRQTRSEVLLPATLPMLDLEGVRAPAPPSQPAAAEMALEPEATVGLLSMILVLGVLTALMWYFAR